MSIRQKFILLLLLASLLFTLNLGSSYLFDWDEINFAEASREMLITGNYSTVQINYEPFYEKPPLFFWVQSTLFKLFGVSSFSARLVSSIVGLINLIFIYLIGKKFRGEEFGLWWALAYCGSLLPFFYNRFGIIDPLFNLFIFSSIISAYYFFENNKIPLLLLSGSLCGLAILTKGPVAFLILALSLGFYLAISKRYKELLYLPIIGIISIIPYLLWLITLYNQGITNIFNDFWQYQLRLLNTQDSGHGGPLYYHFVVVAIGCFPASFLAISHIYKERKSLFKDSLPTLMLILLIVVLTTFGLVKTKIVHYSSMSYFPVSFLAAMYLSYEHKINKILKTIVLAFLSMIFSFVIAFPNILNYIQNELTNGNTTIIKDKFTSELLSKPVYWDTFELLPPMGLLVFVVILIIYFKKGLKQFIFIAFVASSLSVFTIQWLYAPKVEDILQGTLVEYLQSIKSKDCYFKIIGYKSYLEYFYGEKRQNQVFKSKLSDDELIKLNFDKDFYFLCKSKDIDRFKVDGITLLSTKYGYALLIKRKYNANNY
jgi:4-amino-4-deoxy-L-arabinose transferase-like glycosyltransferase